MKKPNVQKLRLPLCLLLYGMFFVLNENTAAQDFKVLMKPQINSVFNQGGETSRRPKVLTQTEKIQRAQQVLDAQGQKVSAVNSPLTLGATNMFVQGKAKLLFFKPLRVSDINGDGGSAKFSANATASTGESILGVEMTTPTAGKYLIDLSISAASTTKFTLTGEGNILTSAGKAGFAQNHLSFVVEAKKSGETLSFYLAGDLVWIFYSCEISQIK